MRRGVLISCVLVVIAFGVVGGTSLFASPTVEDVAPEEAETPELITPGDGSSGVWAYLNSRNEFEKRSPINVIVVGASGDEVIALMTDRTDVAWNETDHDDIAPGELVSEGVNETIGALNATANDSTDESHTSSTTDQSQPSSMADANESVFETATAWAGATGTTRYAFVDPTGDGSEARWITETYQLEDGDYYGTRYHIRLYESPNPDDEWVVMQAHTEHFDWFTLRHAVDGVEEAQSYVELDFMDQPFVDEVWRKWLDNRGPSDADGWATVVELAMIVPIAFAGRTIRERIAGHLTEADRRRFRTLQERVEPRHLIMSGTILALFLGVRVTGIALERHVDVLSMHAIAALLYPVIAIGIPVATYIVASGLERRMDSAIAAALALSLAFVIDYSMIGVDVLPVTVVLHRAGVIVALGLIAGGAARRAVRDSRWNDMLVAGVALWTLLLLSTLFGWI